MPECRPCRLGHLKLACARRVLMPRHGNSLLKSPAKANWRCETSGTHCEDGKGPPRLAWTQRRAKACFPNSIWLRALLLFQAGPGGSRAITAPPTSAQRRLSSKCMRVLLLGRLRMPSPHPCARGSSSSMPCRGCSGEGSSACLPGRRWGYVGGFRK